ncbi:AraC family transcriptional regulator [Acinetobacter baumannii]|uniref:AraC family transcriptional regulator n=2 Tax=Acinetobacter baumannii TaxID=470 RepID=UPI000C180C58|nr:AraC family transcriptional regulator [Acinetobacter baumannii]RDF75282.1 helix-turn-helix domain-containing protein [Acinetobacter baumannii]
MNGLNKPLYRRRISEIYVQLLFEYLEKLGHDPEKVLGEPWPKADSNHLEGVDIDHWESLLIIAKDYLNDPFIGLHVGQTITAQHLGVLGSVFLACENLGAVLERFERYQRLVYDVYPATVRIYTEYVELSWDTKGEQVGPLSDETGRTVIVQFCRSLIRGKERLKEIHFIHERPENVQPYEEYFGCPVLFEQPVALMRFDKEILSLPLKNSDAALVAILEKHADKLLASLPHIDEITDQVRKQIAYLLHQGEPTIEQLAERLNYSRRTLQRRLTEAGTNFRKELNTVRYELAKSYLKDLRLQIVEIALLLGYEPYRVCRRLFYLS